MTPSDSQPDEALCLRDSLARDRKPVLAMLGEPSLFLPREIEAAREAFADALTAGPTGARHARTAELDGQVVGWVCFGPDPFTPTAFDVLWLLVAPERRRLGLGTRLMHDAEAVIRACGGRRLLIETSGRPATRPARRLYAARGYAEVRRIPDFYAAGDDKVVFGKTLAAGPLSAARSAAEAANFPEAPPCASR